MRIAQIDLKAFGHFTERRIRFDAAPDFHIAYGPNEAGKTTLSRALRAALFGIAERTTDNHLHANANLRVGVVLASPGGEQLAAMRRKARKNSLVKYDPTSGEELGEAIADEQLAAWLGGLTEGLYGSMFGLNHEELVAGGKALSEGKGELGQSLFEAGAGLTSIRTLRERLAKEADGLFRPRASSSAIFRALDEYAGARKEAREAQTRPAEWEGLRRAVDEAQRAYASAREWQDRLQREARRLERLAAVLPDVAARRLALERLAALGEVTRLPAQAAAERIAAETRLRQAEIARREAANNKATLQAEHDAIALPAVLLDEGGSIETLYYSLDAYRSSRDALGAADSRIQWAQTQVEYYRAALGGSLPEALRPLIPGATLRARVQSLVTQKATLQTEWEAASRQAQAMKNELAELEGELAALGQRDVPASLTEALKAFEAQANPEALGEDLARQAAKLQALLAVEARSLGGWHMDELVAMGTPLSAELQEFREAHRELAERKQSLQNKRETVDNDLAAVTGELEGLMRQGEVPTAEYLAEQRSLRNALWQRIRQQAFPAADAPPARAALPSPEEYEWAVQVADGIADSRFADAARVSQHADLAKRIAQMRNASALERQRLEVAEGQTEELRRNWQNLLEKYSLPSLTLTELTEWLGKRDVFVQRYLDYRDLQSQQDTATGRVSLVRASLSASLVEAGLPACGERETLAQAIGRARDHIEQAGQAATSHKLLARKKKQAEAKLSEASTQIEQCGKALEEWRCGWAEAMAAIFLSAEAGSEEATARLGQFENLEKVLDARDAARAEFGAAQATVSRVEQENARICRVLAFDPRNRPTDAVVETLYERLGAARTLAQRKQTLLDRLGEADKVWAQTEQSIQAAKQDLSGLMAAAGCETVAALVEAEGRSSECLTLEQEIAATEARLVSAAALPLQEVLVQAEGQDIVLVKTALDRMGEDLAACTSEAESAHGCLLEATAAFSQIDGEAVAGAAEQKAGYAAAQLSNRVAGYASARLASAILAQVIETYQQRHQGPLLARASELFAAITGGRFVKVATDFDEDMSILVGVRPSGRRDTVGNLSTGTRDQLFLALRLAAIESHIASQGPMPVVVDDIVINFDDASASATFQVLADLAKKTQVLFFTHHEHLLERAAVAIGPTSFRAHQLVGPSANL